MDMHAHGHAHHQTMAEPCANRSTDNSPRRARAVGFIATSADGYIARDDGSIDWLLTQQARVPEGEDCGYAAFIAGVGALVMGRASYEQVLGFAEWPYGSLPVVVLSRRGVAVPAALQGRVQISHEAPLALLQRLHAQGVPAVYVDGGLTLQSFLREGLLDELTVTTVPVLLSRGRPLFGPLPQNLGLVLRRVQHWPFGFVQCTWVPQGTPG